MFKNLQFKKCFSYFSFVTGFVANYSVEVDIIASILTYFTVKMLFHIGMFDGISECVTFYLFTLVLRLIKTNSYSKVCCPSPSYVLKYH